MCLSALSSGVYVYHVHTWDQKRPKSLSDAGGLELYVLESRHVGVGAGYWTWGFWKSGQFSLPLNHQYSNPIRNMLLVHRCSPTANTLFSCFPDGREVKAPGHKLFCEEKKKTKKPRGTSLKVEEQIKRQRRKYKKSQGDRSPVGDRKEGEKT